MLGLKLNHISEVKGAPVAFQNDWRALNTKSSYIDMSKWMTHLSKYRQSILCEISKGAYTILHKIS